MTRLFVDLKCIRQT